MSDVVSTILAVTLVLAVASLLLPLAARLRVPHTVLLAVFGLALGFGDTLLAKAGGGGILADTFSGLQRVGLGANTFLYLFLPPLLFTAGLMIDVRRLADEIWAVLLLAVVAVLVCIGVVGLLVHWATGFSLLVCLLLGAIVSTTDPAAVIGIFRDLGAPRRLSILAEGESLFNDAAAISVFAFLIPVIAGQAALDAASPALAFLREFLGGLALGWVLARVAIAILPRFGESGSAVASVTISLAYLAFILGDRYIHVSGVVAVVAAALTLAAMGPTRLQPKVWDELKHTWHHLEYWANALIFVLAAMVSAKVLGSLTAAYAWGLAALVVAAFGARSIVLFGLLPILERFRLVQPVDHRYKSMIVWGGLRGAVTVVLALVAAGDPRLPDDVKLFIAMMATLFVLFTLFVNAPTLRPLMRRFGLDELTPTEAALRDRALTLTRAEVAQQYHEAARAYGLSDVDSRAAAPSIPAEGGVGDGDITLTIAERRTVGLLTLCAREKELYLEHFEAQTLSRRMVSLLVAFADRLLDRVKTEGAPGYELALRAAGEMDQGSRVALWLHRRLRIEKPLADRLADRFEALLIVRQILGELEAFNRESVAKLLGHVVAEELAALLQRRRVAVEDALKALSLQYGGYADAVGRQHLARTAIRFEQVAYQRQLRDSMISREVYEDLQRGLEERREHAARRPPLDLGMELTRMIGRVSLFAGLDPATLRRVGRLLSAQMATPGEAVVKAGDEADAMYFIAAGEVSVKLKNGGDVKLGEGAFFGEMALLDNLPRNADVVATGYVHLLRLDASDFRRLLAVEPSLRAGIETEAARRRGEPAPAGKPAAGKPA